VRSAKRAPEKWTYRSSQRMFLGPETGRVSPPMELLDYVWCYLLFHPFCRRDKRVVWYLPMCLVTKSVVAVRERLTNNALMSSFIVRRAASWHIDTTSAPEHPSVCGDMRGGGGQAFCGMKTYQKGDFRNVGHRVDAHLG